MRDRRRIIEATAVAALLGGAPSTLAALRHGRELRATVDYLKDATRAAGTLVPPGRPGSVRGALAHVGVSLACGELLACVLPERHSVLWGAGAGLTIGVVNVGVIGRRFPAIAALPLILQLADNVAFGAIFAAVVDRQPEPDHAPPALWRMARTGTARQVVIVMGVPEAMRTASQLMALSARRMQP